MHGVRQTVKLNSPPNFPAIRYGSCKLDMWYVIVFTVHGSCTLDMWYVIVFTAFVEFVSGNIIMCDVDQYVK